MKKKTIFLGLSALAALSLVSCSNEDIMTTDGEGILALRTSFDSSVKVESRVEDDELARLNETLQLWVYKHTGEAATSGVIRQYKGISEIPSSLPLSTGSYAIEAWAGDSVSADWEKRWYHAVVDNVNITKGETSQIEVVCKIANVAVEVNYDEEVLNTLAIDQLTVNHTRGELVFEGNTPEHTMGYFMMPNGDTQLDWILEGHRKQGDGVDEALYTSNGSILNVEKGHKYIFNVTLAGGEDNPVGGGFLNITVKEEPLAEENIGLNLNLAPVIDYYDGGDIDIPVRTAPGQVGEQTFKVEASGTLTSVVLECDQLTDLIGGNDVDILTIDKEGSVYKKLNDEEYITWSFAENDNASALYIKLLQKFTDLFSEEGTYTVKIKASSQFSDGTEPKTTEKTATFNISDSPIAVTPFKAEEAAPNELTVNSAVVKGEILDFDKLPDNPEITMYYTEGKETSRASWQEIPATISGNTYSAEFTGLNPGTTYSYYAAILKADGDIAYTDIDYVTTEEALQLPNASFEITKGTSPLLFYDKDEDMFWDSGNHGSSTLKKNVTVTTTSMVHSGNQAISLESQKVAFLGIGKFAAGNIFAGAYLKTDNTDGELGWGRPFTGRPTKLKVWAHYTPVAIDEREDDAPDEYVKGEMDRGIIYVALMDDYTVQYEVDSKNQNAGIVGKTVNFPVIIKTKAADRQLFNPDGEHVIAYGEHVFAEATSGNKLVEITVDIDYSRGNPDYTKDNIRPSYIVLTASASKGGDYFTGGSGSKLVLDDIELVYE